MITAADNVRAEMQAIRHALHVLGTITSLSTMQPGDTLIDILALPDSVKQWARGAVMSPRIPKRGEVWTSNGGSRRIAAVDGDVVIVSDGAGGLFESSTWFVNANYTPPAPTKVTYKAATS